MKRANTIRRLLALLLAAITVFGAATIQASAASYSTGSYTVTTNGGVNVRSGAGTNYSRVGAARNGTSFTVSKISGGWGYTSSIQCTNGTRSGWVYLSNCRYNGSSSRATYNDVFASEKGSGYSVSQGLAAAKSTFTKGTFVYVWGYVHDINGNLYSSYSGGKSCNMTLAIYRPNGQLAYSYTYNGSDNNWIGQRLDETGTWYIRCKLSGSLKGDNIQTITVKESASQNFTTTVTINASSLEAWSKEVKDKELGLTGFGRAITNGSDIWIEGNMIVGREILSYKKIRVYVPPYGPDTGNSGKYVYVNLPYRIRYTVHKHEYGTKINAQYYGNFLVGLVNMKIVHTQQCSCGRSYTCTWEMPDLTFEKVQVGNTYMISSKVSGK